MQPWEACILCSFSTSSSVIIIEIGNKVTFSLTPNQGLATKHTTVKWPIPMHVLTTILIFAFQSFWFKLRSRSPCCLSNVQFDIEIPEDDNIQVTLI